VVIRGESGTGKELVARSLHGCSRRSSGPLVAVNCAEIGENLATSELFGHQKGAFTGAVREHGGLVESAHGGTLFLDEIGEIDPAIQAKLLRFLERGEARAVGEARSRKVNVRLISATHAPLETRMEEGTFRSDLFYRLAGAEIHLPPLRERGDDLEILTRHFVRAEGPDRSERPWSARAWSIWRAYAWPGNVRELRHEVRRLLALHPTESRIEPHHLSPRLHRPAHSAGSPPARPVGTLRSVLREVERKQVALALDAAGGNVSRAARMLGLTRQGLSKKLNALDLRSP
jgi:DNA-binding NtrC family response regulator